MGSLLDRADFNQRLFYPRDDARRCPAEATDLWVYRGSATLHVRWHHTLRDGPTVLLFHGNGETVSDYDDAAPEFAHAGANLAVVDYRGYGLSTGAPTLREVLGDAPAVLATVRAAVRGRLYVMGRSLGSLCAAALYARDEPGVSGFIYESGLTDLAALVRRLGLEAPAAFDDETIETFDPRPKLARGTLPLLVLHGERDRLIPVEEGREALSLAGAADKALVVVAGRGHNDLSREAVYWDAIARRVRG